MGSEAALDLDHDEPRRLSRRSWLAMTGVAGLVAVGGYALAGGFRSRGPRWVVPLEVEPGGGSAAADGGSLYVHISGNDGSESVLALDGATGAQRWTARLDSLHVSTLTMIPAGPALVVGTGDTVSVRDSGTGDLRWQIPGSHRSDPSGSQWPSTAVGVADGVVVTWSAAGVEGLDVRTGDLLWEVRLRSPDFTTDVVAHNGMCIAASAHRIRTESGVHSTTWIDSWDLRTGQPAWSTSAEVEESFGSAGTRIFPSGDRVVVDGAPEGSLVLEAATGEQLLNSWAVGLVAGDVIVNLHEGWTFLELKGVDLADGSVLWSESFGSSEASPSLRTVGSGDLVYVWESEGTPVALDAASGATRWTYRGQYDGSTAAVIAAHGRDVYLVTGDRIEAFTVT